LIKHLNYRSRRYIQQAPAIDMTRGGVFENAKKES
jgi:hypothetical protein